MSSVLLHFVKLVKALQIYQEGCQIRLYEAHGSSCLGRLRSWTPFTACHHSMYSLTLCCPVRRIQLLFTFSSIYFYCFFMNVQKK